MVGQDDNIEHIGLLFVHGIGEQQRFEHLRNSAHEYAELLRQAHENAVVTVTDRTEGWPYPVGSPSKSDVSPITIAVTPSLNGDAVRHVHFECQEVWWADLGTRSGLADTIGFWLWGLGQWGAPMYREIDASGLPKNKLSQPGDKHSKRVPSLTRLPDQLAGNLAKEPLVRFRLALAGLAAALIAASWMLIKRGLQTLLSQAPSPTLIVRYVGDVRTYEARWQPGDSNLSDPGHPRRVAIRRRMITEMVAMGTRAYEGKLSGWYVCAHSLGTVVAYNGLTEIAHALPNYLPAEQWTGLPGALRRDALCEKRKSQDISQMMPGRPDWLSYDDVIHRQRLFAKLRGVLTYGSPLDKFAALWPRIVATATDQHDANGQAVSPFPGGCEWLNLAAPEDPVAGTLESYNTRKDAPLAKAIPRLINIVTPVGWKFGLAHIGYFTGRTANDRARGTLQKRAVMRWMLQECGEPFDQRLQPPDGDLVIPQSRLLVHAWLIAGYAAILTLLPIFTGLFWLLVYRAGGNILKANPTKLWPSLESWCSASAIALGVALTIVLFFGLLRWVTESRFNRKEAEREYTAAVTGIATTARTPSRFSLWQTFLFQLAVYCDRPRHILHWVYRLFPKTLPEPADSAMEIYWRWVFWLYFWQAFVARVFLALALLLALLASLTYGGCLHGWPFDTARTLGDRLLHSMACWNGLAWPLLAALFLMIACVAQSWLNKIVPAANPLTSKAV